MSFCPLTLQEPCTANCAKRGLCIRMDQAPIDLMLNGVKPLVHFIGFRDPQRWTNAVRIFGEPDVIHHVWDQRAQKEIVRGWDIAIFAKGDETYRPSPFNYDDSNQPDDPASKERN